MHALKPAVQEKIKQLKYNKITSMKYFIALYGHAAIK